METGLRKNSSFMIPPNVSPSLSSQGPERSHGSRGQTVVQACAQFICGSRVCGKTKPIVSHKGRLKVRLLELDSTRFALSRHEEKTFWFYGEIDRDLACRGFETALPEIDKIRHRDI
jgi:hypothetical protein